MIGIDLAKRVFQLCVMTQSGPIVWEKRLRRSALIKFLEDEAPHYLVGLEACGGAVNLMPRRAVKAYREGVHKSDRRDTRAVAEAAGRGQVAAVQIKSAAAQATQALMRVRERRIRLRGVGPLRAREMRRYLVLAAQTLLTRVDRIKEPPQDRLLAWAEQMLRRKMHNVAVVAVAAKLARIASAVTASNQPYQPSPVGSQPV